MQIHVHVCIRIYAYTHTNIRIYSYICIRIHRHTHILIYSYGVATISRLLKIIGLFCRIQSLLQGSFANETYNFKEPTNQSHPILFCRQDTSSDSKISRMQIHVHDFVCKYAYTHTSIHIYSYICIRIHTYTHTHIFIFFLLIYSISYFFAERARVPIRRAPGWEQYRRCRRNGRERASQQIEGRLMSVSIYMRLYGYMSMWIYEYIFMWKGEGRERAPQRGVDVCVSIHMSIWWTYEYLDVWQHIYMERRGAGRRPRGGLMSVFIWM